MNQTCRRIRPDLHAWAFGRLDADAQVSIEAHTKSCAECREVLEQVRTAVHFLDQWEPPLPSRDLTARIRSAVLAHDPSRRAGVRQRIVAALGGPWRWTIPLRVAGVALIVLAIVVVRRSVLDVPVDEPGVRDVQVSVGASPAPTPVDIVVPDQRAAFDAFSKIVSSRGGRLVRRRPVGDGLEVTCAVPESEVAALLKLVTQLGEVTRPASGYRDGAGNVVVVLRHSGAGVAR